MKKNATAQGKNNQQKLQRPKLKFPINQKTCVNLIRHLMNYLISKPYSCFENTSLSSL